MEARSLRIGRSLRARARLSVNRRHGRTGRNLLLGDNLLAGLCNLLRDRLERRERGAVHDNALRCEGDGVAVGWGLARARECGGGRGEEDRGRGTGCGCGRVSRTLQGVVSERGDAQQTASRDIDQYSVGASKCRTVQVTLLDWSLAPRRSFPALPQTISSTTPPRCSYSRASMFFLSTRSIAPEQPPQVILTV